MARSILRVPFEACLGNQRHCLGKRRAGNRQRFKGEGSRLMYDLVDNVTSSIIAFHIQVLNIQGNPAPLLEGKFVHHVISPHTRARGYVTTRLNTLLLSVQTSSELPTDPHRNRKGDAEYQAPPSRSLGTRVHIKTFPGHVA